VDEPIYLMMLKCLYGNEIKGNVLNVEAVKILSLIILSPFLGVEVIQPVIYNSSVKNAIVRKVIH